MKVSKTCYRTQQTSNCWVHIPILMGVCCFIELTPCTSCLAMTKGGQRWTQRQRWGWLPVHQSQWCLHSHWAAQTCHSSWWIPTNKPPSWGSCRIAVCWIPWGKCCTGKGLSRRSLLDFWWLRWGSCGESWPQCSPTNWSNDGCQHGYRQGSAWARSWTGPGWTRQATYLREDTHKEVRWWTQEC